jgi:hypothetical protein
MHSRLRRAALAVLVLLAACSANPAPGGTTAVTPPERIGGDHPDFQDIRPSGDSRTDVVVMVDADGRPDMSTLRITGSGAPTYRDALTSWIERSNFKPARLNGAPVRAEYRTKLEVQVRVQRR